MKHVLEEYFKVIKKRKLIFLALLICIGTSTTLEVLSTTVFRDLATNFTKPFSTEISRDFGHLFFVLTFYYAGLWLGWRFFEFFILKLENDGMCDLDKKCFDILKRQKYEFFQNNFAGSLNRQASRFVSGFETFVDWLIFHFFQNIVLLSVSFYLLYVNQKELLLWVIIWLFIFFIWTFSFSFFKIKYDQESAKWDSKVGAIYSDNLSNIFTIKHFGLEEAEQKSINKVVDIATKKRRMSWTLDFINFGVLGALTIGIELFVLNLMIEKWQMGGFSVGNFVLFQTIFILLVKRVWEIGRNFRNFFSAMANASEMTEIIQKDATEKERHFAKNRKITQGSVEFSNVTFSYDKKTLFKNFNLKIEAGEKVALVGHSGSGKTSITSLLLRFFDIQKGSILLDEKDQESFTLKSLRHQISLVPQTPELFHRSLKDNIILNHKASKKKLIEVAKQAQCFDFIQKLPKKFDTLVGEQGVKLSGGEKQRIAIARAFLEDAPIVILDEATSALDSVTEQLIQQAIFELIKNKTAIVIAHRLSTILKMDRIIVMDNGNIIEIGTHNELIKKSGKYAEMWKHQTGDFLS
jgi:ATP-binding cassette subfamily B protein